MTELPSDFTTLMRQQYGDTVAERLFEGILSEPVVSIRLNPKKTPVFIEKSASLDKRDNTCSKSPIEQWENVPWCPNAYYLPQRPAFTFDPLFHAGAYYVQEASSMFLAEALKQHLPSKTMSSRIEESPLVALDLCAAPGGKSTLIRSLLPDDALLVSNEPMAKRAQVLAENMQKWGHPNTVITQNFPDDFAPLVNMFDLIVADVPCSGEGMFRKDEEAIREWSLDNVALCWKRQRDIVSSIWHCLKPGGLFIYSTCTYNHLEDEDNVNWIASTLGADILPIETQDGWGIQGHHHFMPGFTKGEGFYLAALRKHGSSNSNLENNVGSHPTELEYAACQTTIDDKIARRKEKDAKGRKTQKSNGAQRGKDALKTTLPPSIETWLEGDFEWLVQKEHCIAIPINHAATINKIRHCLNTLVFGIEIAEMKGKDWIPSHALALNTALNKNAFPKCEVSYEDAVAYLRHDVLRIEAERGIVLVTFDNHPLGFVKNIGNRANNLYPQEWRIRTTYTTPFTLAGKDK